jgi:hypothetical protein
MSTPIDGSFVSNLANSGFSCRSRNMMSSFSHPDKMKQTSAAQKSIAAQNNNRETCSTKAQIGADSMKSVCRAQCFEEPDFALQYTRRS